MISHDLQVDTSRTHVLDVNTWQRVVVVDMNGDNPRRTVRLSLLAG